MLITQPQTQPHRKAHSRIDRLNRIDAWQQVPLAPTDAAYLAGLIDGEGYVGLVRFGKRASGEVAIYPRLTIAMTDKAIVNWVDVLTGYIGTRGVLDRHNPKHRPAYQWHANGKAAEAVLAQVLPYMRVKRRQALALLRFVAAETPKQRASVFARYQPLNKRGPKAAPSESN